MIATVPSNTVRPREDDANVRERSVYRRLGDEAHEFGIRALLHLPATPRAIRLPELDLEMARAPQNGDVAAFAFPLWKAVDVMWEIALESGRGQPMISSSRPHSLSEAHLADSSYSRWWLGATATTNSWSSRSGLFAIARLRSTESPIAKRGIHRSTACSESGTYGTSLLIDVPSQHGVVASRSP